MGAKIFGPRKRRTRQHVIADLSVHHVEGFILDEGQTAQRVYSDYGYDLYCTTYVEEGYVEAGLVCIQVKASETFSAVGSDLVFDVDVRDYHLWMIERSPVILIIFDALKREAFWLDVQHYFIDDESRRPNKGAKTIRVRIPKGQRWNRDAVKVIREQKQASIHAKEKQP